MVDIIIGIIELIGDIFVEQPGCGLILILLLIIGVLVYYFYFRQ